MTTRDRRRVFAGGSAGAMLSVAVAAFAASMTTAVDPHTLPVTSNLAQRLRAHVQFLAGPDLHGRKPGTEGNQKAAQYIAEQFHAIGLEPLASLHGYRQPLDGKLGDNLIGLRPADGPTGEAPWILVGAHFDHLGGNYLGADDNASAIGILLETARAMPALAHHHLLFVAFNAEEPPYIRTPLMGSQQLVDRL
ncbi:MAG: M28 family peptidase, partial [Nitrospirae bacterium]|nr:M28 family peptidase [Nitrospirota bacterium]